MCAGWGEVTGKGKYMKKYVAAPIEEKVSYKIVDNPFEAVFVDITNRCNMSCNFCYNPERLRPDMSLEYFKRLCAELPSPVHIKLCGGEPTLHPQLLDLMRVAHQYRHALYIASNGTRFIDAGFMRSLKKLRDEGVTFTLGLSMDGGYSNRVAYQMINGQDCLADKMQAFHGLVDSGLNKICLTAIILRGVNENVIPELLLLAKEHFKVIRFIHFRSAGKSGIWQETEPYTLEEIKTLVSSYFTEEEFRPRCLREVHCTPEEKRDCCYRFRPNSRLQIALIEFDSQKSKCCPKRGRIILGADRIQPFFLSMH
jgi:molybdenum cofactor biosynthesis enzyme MoaA